MRLLFLFGFQWIDPRVARYLQEDVDIQKRVRE